MLTEENIRRSFRLFHYLFSYIGTYFDVVRITSCDHTLGQAARS
jgi:hypothetical protein